MKTLLAIFSAFLVLAATAVQAADQPALVRKVKGKAEYALPGTDSWEKLKPRTKLPIGSKVRTGDRAEVIVRVVPGAALRIAENSEVTLDSMAYAETDGEVTKRKANINLTNGTVSALLDHNDPKVTDFRIKTPQGSAAARGTFYAVTVEEGNTFVSVKEGKVGVEEYSETEPES